MIGSVGSTKISILGAGAWGQALADLLTDNGHTVTLWSRRFGKPMDAVLQGAEIVISAVAMAGIETTIAQMKALSPCQELLLVTATKGLAATNQADDFLSPTPGMPKTPAQLWRAAFPQHKIVVLSGPNLSQEIQQRLPAAAVVASEHPEAAAKVQQVLMSQRFRVYTSLDPIGVELGGALKNVIAIATGTCDGLNLGANAKAGLVTRGLAEMIRIARLWGAKPETFYGLSGLGDLLATSGSALSRNYQVGFQLAQGQSLSNILTHLKGTAEGINTVSVIVGAAQTYQIPAPISLQVYRLLRGEITPQRAIAALMQRDSKPEHGCDF